jgi:hypothetical protein
MTVREVMARRRASLRSTRFCPVVFTCSYGKSLPNLVR